MSRPQNSLNLTKTQKNSPLARAVPGGGTTGPRPPPQSAMILKQLGSHFGNHPAPSQYAALPNRKSWNRPCPLEPQKAKSNPKIR